MRERIANYWELLLLAAVRALLPAARRHRVSTVPPVRPAPPVPPAYARSLPRPKPLPSEERLLRQLHLERRRIRWRAAYEAFLAGAGDHSAEAHA